MPQCQAHIHSIILSAHTSWCMLWWMRRDSPPAMMSLIGSASDCVSPLLRLSFKAQWVTVLALSNCMNQSFTYFNFEKNLHEIPPSEMTKKVLWALQKSSQNRRGFYAFLGHHKASFHSLSWDGSNFKFRLQACDRKSTIWSDPHLLPTTTAMKVALCEPYRPHGFRRSCLLVRKSDMYWAAPKAEYMQVHECRAGCCLKISCWLSKLCLGK